MTTVAPVTAEQLLRMPDDGCRYELIAGELRKMVPAGWKHGAVEGRLEAGAVMVWVVNSSRRTVTVYRSATDIKTLTEKDDLSGDDVGSGFRCRVADVFLKE